MKNPIIPDWMVRNREGIKNILDCFNNKKILLLGDLILDQFIWGEVSRISPEAPVPVVWARQESYMPGGACNVAHNLAVLGASVSLVGIVGNDSNGETLLTELKKIGVDTEGIVQDTGRPTTHKIRVIAHSQQVVRIDRENVELISQSVTNKIIKVIESKIKEADAVIIEDYGKGLITSSLVKKVVELGSRYKKIISVDPKKEHFKYYKGVTTITPNKQEAEEATGIKIKDDDSLIKAGKKLLKTMDAKSVLITLGDKGMYLFEKGKSALHIPTMARQVYDVSGAGDTVIASFTLAVSSGASLPQAAYVANQASGIVVGKIGTATVSKKELLKEIRKWK
ncbi:MAG: D-glycero-beta-D-manno-heptose-7-phosphate kinase [Candidatus Saelkia tenebricola]|nr:D-glycero-beta-D-manno-heptose-7-phosphate kinase [Candidatus Saelkia tenebricola]